MAAVFNGWFDGVDTHLVVEWFDMGGSLPGSDTVSSTDLIEHVSEIQGLSELIRQAGVKNDAPPPTVAAAIDFVLEGLYAQKKISRTEDWSYRAMEKRRRNAGATEPYFDPNLRIRSDSKKKYYN